MIWLRDEVQGKLVAANRLQQPPISKYTNPTAVRPSSIRIAAIPRIIDTDLRRIRALYIGEPATEGPKRDADTGAVGDEGTAEVVGVRDAGLVVSAGIHAAGAAELGCLGGSRACGWGWGNAGLVGKG